MFLSLRCLLCSSVPRRHRGRTRCFATSLTEPSPGSSGTILETFCGLEQMEIPPALPVPFWCLRARCSHLQWNLANSWPESLCQGALVTGRASVEASRVGSRSPDLFLISTVSSPPYPFPVWPSPALPALAFPSPPWERAVFHMPFPVLCLRKLGLQWPANSMKIFSS